MPEFVGYLLLFVGIGVFFVLIHLLMGRLLRPIKPDPEKLTIYECGEPTIGSAWIQFDLRFYVVALLFVIFDVEVAFFFPWAVVFGKANALAQKDLTPEQRTAQTLELAPSYLQTKQQWADRIRELEAVPAVQATPDQVKDLQGMRNLVTNIDTEVQNTERPAALLSWLAFWDILVFFGVLLVGYAYLWKRGDLNWVRSLAAEQAPGTSAVLAPAGQETRDLVGSASAKF